MSVLIKGVHYRSLKKWKYRVETVQYLKTPWKPKALISTSFIQLSQSGILSVFKGYCWDGPSGPTFDRPSFMRGSLFHDALYQLLRMGLLKGEGDRRTADYILRDICIEDGMSPWWARNIVYTGVRLGGGRAARPGVETSW